MVTGSLHGAAPQPAVYIATAQAGDVEMATRIMAHRARRGGNWTTIEEPLKLDEALASAAGHGRPVLVDCLTLWLSNLMLGGGDVDEATDDLLRALDEVAVAVVFVSNEVGLGIVPETPLGRSFRDAQGRLNMRMAERADRFPDGLDEVSLLFVGNQLGGVGVSVGAARILIGSDHLV